MAYDPTQHGWQKLSSDEGADYLYKLLPVKSLAAGMAIITQAAQLAEAAKLDTTTHLSADAHSATITLNSASSQALSDAHSALAQRIDSIGE